MGEGTVPTREEDDHEIAPCSSFISPHLVKDLLQIPRARSRAAVPFAGLERERAWEAGGVGGGGGSALEPHWTSPASASQMQPCT